MAYHLDIDLGGTNIAAGIVDDNFNIVARASRKTNAPRAVELIVDDMAGVCLDACENLGITMDDIESFGVGAPGAVDAQNGTVSASHNVGMFGENLVEMLYIRTNKKFYIENDANAAAYGEFLAGAGKGTKNFRL